MRSAQTGKGILLGEFEGKYLSLGGQQSVLLAAPTRSGKGVGVVIPNLLSWQDSVCVVDIKGENFKASAGFRVKYGQAVYAWAPFDPGTSEGAPVYRSHCHNPLDYVRPDPNHVIGDLLSIAQILWATADHASGTERFFNDHARGLFLGLALYLVETPTLPRTFGELYRQSSGKGRPIKEHVQQLMSARLPDEPLSDECINALTGFLSNSENTLTGILSTFKAPLLIFTEPLVDASTSRSDFSLQDVRKKRLSIYVIIPPNRLADAAVLLNLFFAQLIHLNTGELPQDNPALRYQCLLLMDECTAMGRVAVLAKSIGYFAGYNLRCLTVIQAVSQLDSTYGDKDSRSMVTNHAVQILFAPREQRDAKEYSEMLGTFTERSLSRGRSQSNGPRGGSSTSTNDGPAPRALLMPQEFRELELDQEVVLLENVKPILARKIRYWDDPVFTTRLLPPPEIPVIDLELHRQRGRRAKPIESTASAERLVPVTDFSALPTLAKTATPTELQEFVGQFFDLMLGTERHPQNEITEEAVS